MSLLLDTYVLLSATGASERLPETVRRRFDDPAETLMFSVVSLWEIATKSTLQGSGFKADGRQLRAACLAAGYVELPVTGPQAIRAGELPPIHSDPFDRFLVAQGREEGLTLITTAPEVAAYGGRIELIQTM